MATRMEQKKKRLEKLNGLIEQTIQKAASTHHLAKADRMSEGGRREYETLIANLEFKLMRFLDDRWELQQELADEEEVNA